MKILSILFLLISINYSILAKTKLQSIADDYFSFQALLEDNNRDRCRPKGSCFKIACDSVGRFECDEEDEIQNIQRACRGVRGESCIVNAMSFLHKFEYDENNEMVQLAASCKGYYDYECVRYSCDKLKPFGCDELQEIINVHRACMGY
jgi:hypothetical protein